MKRPVGASKGSRHGNYMLSTLRREIDAMFQLAGHPNIVELKVGQGGGGSLPFARGGGLLVCALGPDHSKRPLSCVPSLQIDRHLQDVYETSE